MIKVILTSCTKKISGKELHSLVKPSQNLRSRQSRRSKPENNSYIVGTPEFNKLPFKKNDPFIIPVGQYEIAVDVLISTKNKRDMIEHLKDEYKSIITALHTLGVDFNVLNLDTGDEEIKSWMKAMGHIGVTFHSAKPNRWTMYPRDMFLYIEMIDTLLVHSQLFSLSEKRDVDCDIIHSVWAEGGKVLFAGDRMIIGGHPEALGRIRERNVIHRLREKGMKISIIPYALFYRISGKNGMKHALYYDHHIDRSASLLVGKDGGYHLIIDPAYRTGPLANPLSVDKSLEIVRAACDKIDVQVHVPKRITVPYASSVVQFGDGNVLAAGKDHEIAATLSDIVGSDNICCTDIAVKCYPVFTSAGLHCLVTESPKPLISP